MMGNKGQNTLQMHTKMVEKEKLKKKQTPQDGTGGIPIKLSDKPNIHAYIYIIHVYICYIILVTVHRSPLYGICITHMHIYIYIYVLILFSLYVVGCFARMYICLPHVSSTGEGQQRA